MGVYVETNGRGELQRRPHGAHGRRPPTKEKDEMQTMRVAIMGEPLCGAPAGSSPAGRRGKKEGEEGASERARRQERRGGERRSAPCSLNEVFFLLFCVRVVALGVDDGRVGVGRVVRPFGLVRQVRS